MIANQNYRIYFSGGAASGKSTLAKKVSERYSIPTVPSVARATTEYTGFTYEQISGKGKEARSWAAMAINLQIAVEFEYMSRVDKNDYLANSYVCDRCGADFLAYAEQQTEGCDFFSVYGRDIKSLVTDPMAIVFLVEPNEEALENAVKDRSGVLSGWLKMDLIRGTYEKAKKFLDIMKVPYVKVPCYSPSGQWEVVLDALHNKFANLTIAETLGRFRPDNGGKRVEFLQEVFGVEFAAKAKKIMGTMIAERSTLSGVGLLTQIPSSLEGVVADTGKITNAQSPPRFQSCAPDFVPPEYYDKERVGALTETLPGLLNDAEIERIFGTGGRIVPFDPGTKGKGYISSGLSSGGYDFVLGNKFRMFSPAHCHFIDPLNIDERAFLEVEAKIDNDVGKPYVMLPPNSYILAETKEWINIPDDILIVCIGKSTYARVGIIANITPLEPGWRGYTTLEISNPTPVAVKIYVGMGIVQALFFRMVAPAREPYGKRSGRYQDQKGLTLPKTAEQGNGLQAS